MSFNRACPAMRRLTVRYLTWGRYLSGPISHGDCTRLELVAIDEFELDALVQTGEQRRSVSGKDRLHNELVLVDQSQVCQCQGECHAANPQTFAGLLLEPLNR